MTIKEQIFKKTVLEHIREIFGQFNRAVDQVDSLRADLDNWIAEPDNLALFGIVFTGPEQAEIGSMNTQLQVLISHIRDNLPDVTP